MHYLVNILRFRSHNKWMGRRHQWNKKWNIADSSRGPSLPTPPDLIGLQIWFEGVSFAPEFQPYETVDGEVYVLENIVGHIN